MNFNETINMTGVDTGTDPVQSPHEKQKLLLHHEDNDYILRLDNSSLELLVQCAKSFYYHKVLGRTSPESAALTYGRAIHDGLELWYKHGAGIDATTLAFSPVKQQIATAVSQAFALNPPQVTEWRTESRCLETLIRYIQRYQAEEFKPRHVEVPFSLPLGTIPVDAEVPYPVDTIAHDGPEQSYPDRTWIDNVHVFWTGKIDLIVTLNQDQSTWVVDHKTHSVGGPGFWDQFKLSQQMMGYVWAGRQINPDDPPRGVLINALYGRPYDAKGNMTKANKEQEFTRQRFIYPDALVDEWQQDVMAMIEDTLSYLVKGHFPKMTAWCIAKYGKCRYHDVCQLPPNQREFHLNTPSFADVTWNPLHK